MKNKPPISLIIVWILCVLWVMALTPMLKTSDIYTNKVLIETVNCEYNKSKHRSYLDINEKEISTAIARKSCDDLLPLLKEGKTVIEKGPKAVLVDSVVSWGLTVDGITIKDFEASKGNSQEVFYFFGLGVSVLVFLSSFYGWRSGKWGKNNENT